jgi:hypothetical protein
MAAAEPSHVVLSLDDIAAADIDLALAWMDGALAGAPRPGSGVDPLPKRKERLKELSISKEFTSKLIRASPREAQEYVDSGMFKVLAMNLHDIKYGAATATSTATLTISNLMHLICALPDLVVQAWKLGAVRSVAELFKAVAGQSQEKSWEALVEDNTLIVTAGFFSVMAVPLEMQAEAPARTIAVKFFK